MNLDGTQRRYNLGKWLVENGYGLDDIMMNYEIRSDEWYIENGLEPRGLTFQFLSNKRPDLGYKSQNMHFRVDSAGTDEGIEEKYIWDGKIMTIPHPSPVGFFANVYGCSGAHGVIVAEFNNVTDDPRKVQCGICRSIMKKAITEYQKILAKQERVQQAKTQKPAVSKPKVIEPVVQSISQSSPSFTQLELKMKLMWYKYLYNNGERDPKMIGSMRKVYDWLKTGYYKPNKPLQRLTERDWTETYLKTKLNDYAQLYIEGERDPKMMDSIDQVLYRLKTGQYK